MLVLNGGKKINRHRPIYAVYAQSDKNKRSDYKIGF